MSRPAGRGAALTGALVASVALALPLSAPATKTPKPKAPHASTGSARHVSGATAELTGNVNPRGQETSYYFQYGPTIAYGIQTATTAAGSGTGGVKVSQAISGLQVGATYHYRVVAVNAAAETTDGRDRVLTTKAPTRGHGSTPKPLALKFVVPKERTVEPYRQPVLGGGHPVRPWRREPAGRAAGQPVPLPRATSATSAAPLRPAPAGAFSLPRPGRAAEHEAAREHARLAHRLQPAW